MCQFNAPVSFDQLFLVFSFSVLGRDLRKFIMSLTSDLDYVLL